MLYKQYKQVHVCVRTLGGAPPCYLAVVPGLKLILPLRPQLFQPPPALVQEEAHQPPVGPHGRCSPGDNRTDVNRGEGLGQEVLQPTSRVQTLLHGAVGEPALQDALQVIQEVHTAKRRPYPRPA